MTPTDVPVGEMVTVTWDAEDNPLGTTLELFDSWVPFGPHTVTSLSTVQHTIKVAPFYGATKESRFWLVASYSFAGTVRQDITAPVFVHIV